MYVRMFLHQALREFIYASFNVVNCDIKEIREAPGLSCCVEPIETEDRPIEEALVCWLAE